MPTDINKGFDNGDLLRDIRQDILNPVTVKVAAIERDIVVMKPKVDRSIIDINKDIATKSLIINKNDGSPPTSVSLDGMFQEGSDLTIVDDNGNPFQKITKLDIHEARIDQINPGEVELRYEWDKIVPHHQKKLTVGKTGVTATIETDALYFKGPNVTIDNLIPGVATVNIPPAQPLTVSIPGGSPAILQPVPVTTIELEGESTGSTIIDGKLTLHLNTGGGGTVTNQNFKGFFDTLGDIESLVQDPIDGKSYAFAKDSTLGGQYYTPYFYVNNNWTELKQDPALTYFATGAPTNQGVFSIKPNPGITVDSTGQLNLDGLSTPAEPRYFHGFHNDVNELKAAVPNPTLDLSFAYIKHSSGSGWVAVRYVAQGSARQWAVIAAIGGFSLLDKKDNPTMSSACFGIYKDENFDLDSKGILSLRPIDTTTDVIISDMAGGTTGGKVNKIKLETGKSYAEVSGSELIMKHPQRVISYNSTFEAAHNSRDYEGNIFYDETSRTWMGWGIPDVAGGVDRKWTKVFHRGMSDEVKDLSKRLPAKTASVQTGVLDDNPAWSYNGITYLEKDSDQLPEDLKNVCGGYITTSVQDKDAPGVTIAQHRIQTCAADRVEGGTWVRRYISDSSPGASVDWSPWIRTSFSFKDIEAHMTDPGAHKSSIKYYRIFALTGKCQSIFAQTAGGALGGLHANNGVPLADNYGYTNSEKDYLDVPYPGDFRVKGAVSLSGYKDNNKKYPTGRWSLVFRIKDRSTGLYSIIGQSYYNHPDEKVPYPTLSFTTNSITLDRDQELVTNLTFSEIEALNREHPDLYLVPSRSNLVLEDIGTRAGSAISNGMRLFFGNLDVIGDVAIKSHHATLTDPKSQIRVYGEPVPKKPTEMIYTS